MAASRSKSVTWEEVELSESYLVSGMFDEAATLASSILMRIHENEHVDAEDCIMLHDMLESAAMVLIQSSKELGRTSELLDKLPLYFGSVSRIPVQVVLTWACIQVSGGFAVSARQFLEDFLMKWQFSEGKYVLAFDSDAGHNVSRCPDNFLVLETAEYLQVVEFYVVTLLGMVLNDPDHAIFWVEKAQLSEEARQDLLRKLSSLFSPRTSSSVHGSVKQVAMDEPEVSPFEKEVGQCDKSRKTSTLYPNGATDVKQSLLKGQRGPGGVCSWFRNVTVKVGNARFALSNRKVFLGCLIFLICYILRKKQQSILRVAKRRAASLKQAILDLWELAFSYQVNPLAAVQALPAPTPTAQ